MPQHRPSLSSSLGPERPQDTEVLKGKDVPGEGDALSRRSDRGVQGPTADLQHLQCVLEDGCWQEALFQGCVGSRGTRYDQVSPHQTSCSHPASPLVTRPPQDSSNKASFSIRPAARALPGSVSVHVRVGTAGQSGATPCP